VNNTTKNRFLNKVNTHLHRISMRSFCQRHSGQRSLVMGSDGQQTKNQSFMDLFLFTFATDATLRLLPSVQ